jgi:fatty-acyl-CoA synthase
MEAKIDDGWLRVDGENLASAPIERILLRHSAISEAAVYGVPDHVGDKVACALVLRDSLTFEEFSTFLDAQPDLSPKAWPSLVRVLDAIPRTATNKVLVRELRDLPAELGETWEH